MSFFPQSHVWLCSLFYDWCHKKLIELSAQRVRGQTHPVRNRLVVSHGEGLGGCDLLIVWGMMDWEGERGGGESAACGSHELWRKSVATRGDSGWLDNSVTTWCSFLKLGKKTEGWNGERESKNMSNRGCSSKNILAQRLRHHSELFENTSVEVKNKSTMRYLAHSCYVTKLKFMKCFGPFLEASSQ